MLPEINDPTNAQERDSRRPSLRLRLPSPGQTFELVQVQSGQGLAQRLATLGLVPGARFTVESGPSIL